MHYALVAMRGRGSQVDPFAPPTDQAYTVLDLRPDSARTDGFALLATPERERGAGLYLGDTHTELSPAVARQLTARLGVTLDATPTLGELLGELLLHQGSEDGKRWRPLAPGRVTRPGGQHWRYEVLLGGEVVFEREVPAVAGGMQIADDFKRADSTSVGADWEELREDWFISGQSMTSSVNSSDAELRHRWWLNTANHSAEAYLKSDGGWHVAGVCTRWASGATRSFYMATANPGDSAQTFEKRVAGTVTILLRQPASLPNEGLLRLESRGSTHTAKYAGTTFATTTDTSIPGNVQVGLFTYANNFGVRFSQFRAADFQASVALGGASTPRGTLVRGFFKRLTSSSTPVGTLSRTRVVRLALAGAVTAAGTLRRAGMRVLGGVVTARGTVRRVSVAKRFTGKVTAQARMSLGLRKRLDGSVTTSGSVTSRSLGRLFGRPAAAVLSIRSAAQALIRARRG